MAPTTSTINIFFYVLTTLIIPTFDVRFACQVGAHVQYPNDGGNGRRLTKIYSLKQGPLQGLVLNPSRQQELQNVEVFLGIPYAAPPLGHLRFMPPVNAIPWHDVKQATKFAPVCPQMIPDLKKNPQASAARVNYMARLRPYLTNQSEDCLYLNVYVPENDPKHRPGRQKFPVLVFIHGESFEWNSGNPYDGSVLASYGNIMVVTINFRLGILGFMKPNITEHPIGNFGLLDQVAALQWLKENVRELGGDPNSVTLMGHGTGAACVNLLMVSPVANGLFHRAILMSGSALADWALATHTTVYTLQVVQSLNCPLNDANLTKCLQGKSLRDILSTDILAPRFETSFGPIIDGTVVPSEPSGVMSVYTNLFSKYELLYGVTELESYHELGGIALAHGLLEGERDELLKQYARAVFPSSHDQALSSMLKEYTASHPRHMPSPILNRDCVLDLLSDAQVVAPLIRTADYHSKTNKASYLYVFGHNSENSEYAPLVKSVRGEELAYVFGIPLGASSYHFRSKYTPQEKLLSEAIMLFWTNFAKKGNPNSERVNSFINLDTKDWHQYYLEWPEYDVKSQSYIRLDIPPKIETHYRAKHMKFWNEMLPSMLNNYTNDFDDIIFPITTARPKSIYSSGRTDRIQSRREDMSKAIHNSHINYVTTYGRPHSYPFSTPPKTFDPYREIKLIKTPARPIPSDLIDKKLHMKQKPQSPVRPVSTTKIEEKVEKEVPIKQSGVTLNIIMGIGIIFLLTNIIVFTVLFVKKRKLKQKEQEIQRKNVGHSGNNTDIDSIVNPKRAPNNSEDGVKSGCNVFKLLNAEDNFKSNKRYEKVSTKYVDVCKTPKSDDSGGFGQRFRLRRHLSSSTLDAHTKVRDWIANEIIQRCSPRFMRKNQSNVLKVDISKHTEKNSQDFVSNKPIPNITISEADNKNDKSLKKGSGSMHGGTNSTVSMGTLQSKQKSTKDSEKTTSTSVIGSQSSVMYNKDLDMDEDNRHDTVDSTEGNQDDVLKKPTKTKVSVAVNAIPDTKNKTLLNQRPTELSKSFDFTYNHDLKVNVKEPPLRRSFTTENFKISNSSTDVISNKTTNDKMFKSFLNLEVDNKNIHKQPIAIQIAHKYSISEPVKDINYKEFMTQIPENNPVSLSTFLNIKPPTPFENDINVTSKDESIKVEPLSAAESLLTIQRRNFPKVLPDFPKLQPTKAQKRLSLPPQHLVQNSPLLMNLSFRTGSLGPEKDGSKSPPQPPPRTTSTLDRIPRREMAYNRSSTCPISETREYKTSQSNKINMLDLEKFYSDEIPEVTKRHEKNKEKPTVIIAADNKKLSCEPKVIIKPNSHKTPIVDLIPGARVILDDLDFNFADDFPTLNSIPILGAGQMPSDFTEQLAETNLIRELIGGIDDQVDIFDLIPDTKGPATMDEKQHEIVKINTNPTTSLQKNYENPYYCDTVFAPNDSERTANIKQKFSLNKLQNRSDSISCPVEKSLNTKCKGSKIPKPPIFSSNIKKDKKEFTVLKMLRPKTDSKKKKIPLRFDSPSSEQSCSESSNESKSSVETVKRIN